MRSKRQHTRKGENPVTIMRLQRPNVSECNQQTHHAAKIGKRLHHDEGLAPDKGLVKTKVRHHSPG